MFAYFLLMPGINVLDQIKGKKRLFTFGRSTQYDLSILKGPIIYYEKLDDIVFQVREVVIVVYFF